MIRAESDQDFYQIDFTTVSDWEVFIARIEEILCEWKLSHNSGLNFGTSTEWAVKKEKIVYRDMEFTLNHYYIENSDSCDIVDEDTSKIKFLDDMMSPETDFQNNTFLEMEKVNDLVRFYGLKGFVVLNPVKPQNITSESTVKILLSSLSVAVGNVHCEVPMFARVLEEWQNYFIGVAVSKGVRADYQMVHLKKVPPYCRHLSGVLDIFKPQVASSAMSLDSVQIVTRFTYVLKDWANFSYYQESPYIKYIEGDTVSSQTLRELPLGTTCEPIAELKLHTLWPELQENISVDNETYTDLEPMLAPVWSIKMTPMRQPNSLLYEYVMEYLEKCCSPYSAKELIGELYQRNPNEPDLSQSLNLLTETKLPVISKLIREVNIVSRIQGAKSLGLIPDSVLMPLLYFLFPDADDSGQDAYTFNNEEKPERIDYANTLKSCELDSLVWRLATVMAHVVYSLGGIRAAAHLWYEFTQELRYRWENGILIPGVPLGNPDHKTCLLNQKLQMLNCCIKKKVARQESSKKSIDSRESEDEEFYDCQIETSGDDQKASKSRHSLWNQPGGRLRKCDGLKLLNTGEAMYIPVTQEITPKTEDQLEEDAQLLMQLGSDSYGSELRSRLMSASLYSDMESFKAANPGAILEDFIRWYSPRDWIEDEDADTDGNKKGRLSARMLLPGNMWKEVWDSSKPVPASRQKRLFNDTQEAEKVLHYLDSMSPANALRLLLPVFVHACLATVVKYAALYPLLDLEDAIFSLTKKAVSITRSSTFDIARCQELASEIGAIESLIFQWKSLKAKLFPECVETADQDSLIQRLISGEEVIVPSGPKSELGNRIFIIFAELQKHQEDAFRPEGVFPESAFPTPYQKEFILRVKASRPSPSSRKLPQKLTAQVQRDQILIAACFSADTVFI